MIANDKTNKPTIRYERFQPYEGKHRVPAAPSLSDAQLEELMARFRERFRLTDA